MPPTAQQRREQILLQVLERGHVAVRDLANGVAVSEATVRRDLRTLADAGEIDLVYGGATIPSRPEASFTARSLRNIEAKRIVGRLATELVHENETIFMDSGTTLYEMIPHLKRRRGISAIVTSARFALDLGSGADLNVILVGGQYRPERIDSVGPLATEFLEQLRGFRAFIGADGLSRDFGITAHDIDSAHLNRVAMKNAREIILLVDHTKFVSSSLFKIGEFEAISRVVTDREPPPEWRSFLADRGIEIVIPRTDDR